MRQTMRTASIVVAIGALLTAPTSHADDDEPPSGWTSAAVQARAEWYARKDEERARKFAEQRQAYEKEQALKREQQANAQAAARRADEEVRAQAAAQQEERLADPKWARPLWTAQLCRASEERTATIAVINKEKKLARLAGVVDLELMHEYQNTIRDDDELIAHARSELSTLKLRPMRCKDLLIARIEDCLDVYACNLEGNLSPKCADPEILAFARLTWDFDMCTQIPSLPSR